MILRTSMTLCAWAFLKARTFTTLKTKVESGAARESEQHEGDGRNAGPEGVRALLSQLEAQPKARPPTLTHSLVRKELWYLYCPAETKL